MCLYFIQMKDKYSDDWDLLCRKGGDEGSIQVLDREAEEWADL